MKKTFFRKSNNVDSNLKWHSEETNIFVFIFIYYMEIHKKTYDMLDAKDWEYISRLLLRQSTECQIKWSSLMKSRSNKKSWSPEEDRLLTKIIKYVN